MKEREYKPGFLCHMWKLTKKLHNDIQPIECYERMNISKQEFFAGVRNDREVRAANWLKWRKGFNISKSTWWKEAQTFHETEKE